LKSRRRDEEETREEGVKKTRMKKKGEGEEVDEYL